MAAQDKPHLLPLGHGGWATWRDMVLRGAGFPADIVEALADPTLAAAAEAAIHDAGEQETYLKEYQSAVDRLSAALQDFAASPRLREAITWQNAKLIKLCLDKVAAGETRNRRARAHQMTVANYVQRYSLKNDTIGFTGPVGWARWTEDGPPLAMRVGKDFLTRRTVYFETWAIEALGKALAADERLRPWLAPRLFAAHRLDGDTLHVPGRAPEALTPAESALLALADGARTVTELAAELAGSGFSELGDLPALLGTLDSLAARHLVRLDLRVEAETWPERTLLARLEAIAHPQARQARQWAVDALRGLMAARDRVSACAGDAVALETAFGELSDCFQAITGVAGERRPGETYAGRSLVYEDTVRGAGVDFGPLMREQLSQPLGLVLDSARWLVAEIGQEYERVLLGLYGRRAAQLGTPAVPLAALLSLATSQLYHSPRRLPAPVRRVVAEFQRRWAALLQIPSEGSQVDVRSADLAERAAELFPARELPWATAMYHSPDLMLAAADPEAIERGEHLFVLGELHLSFNTMEARVFVEQHDDPASLLAGAESDLGDRRIYAIAPMESVNSRTTPPSALLSPQYTYWTMYPEAATPPGPVIPAADLVVCREGDQLVVRSVSGTFEAPLISMLAEHLAGVTVNAFKPVAKGPHGPRITIDRLVIARESWTFLAADVAWAAELSEADRFLGARRWWLAHGLPERAFYTVPVEDKPTFVDFSSLAYVNILAKAIRKSVVEDNGSVTLTEMLPDPSQLWLQDGDGNRYTSEFRTISVDMRMTED